MALLVVQAALLGWSAFPLTRLATRRHGLGWGGLFGVAYAFSWGLQSAMAVQFHEVAFAVPLIALALVAFLEGRLRAAVAWAAALVFVKEDLGLTVAVFGLVMAWRPPRGSGEGETSALQRERRLLGLGLVAWGAAWFVLATYVILPAFNPAGEYAYTDRLAGLLNFFVPAEKGLTLLMLVTSAGLVGLRSPLVLVTLPTLIWRFIGNVPAYWGHSWHYSAVLMPMVFAALLDGMEGQPVLRRRWLPPLLAAATTLALGPSMSLGRLAEPEFHQTNARWASVRAIVDLIPEGSTVEADPVLMAPLVRHAEVYAFQNQNPAPEFVAIDEGTPTWGPSGPPLDAAVWATERHGTPYQLVFHAGGFQLARSTSTD